MKKRNAYALPARMRRNAGPHTHKYPPREKFTIDDFTEELEDPCISCEHFTCCEDQCMKDDEE